MSLLLLTSEGSVSTCLQIHFTVAPLAHLSGVVADVVAAIFAAAEADALLEAVGAGALVGKAHVVLVHQGVYKQVHSALMLALHHLHEIWGGNRGGQVRWAMVKRWTTLLMPDGNGINLMN